jgi:hypothetical protein
LSKLVRTSFAMTALVALVAACQSGTAAPSNPTPNPVATVAPSASTSPTPVPTTASTTSPTLDAVGHLFPSDAGRTLEPGRYAVAAPFPEPFTFAVPAGFRLDGYREGAVAASSTSGFIAAVIVDGVFPDPCKAAGGAVKAAESKDLVEALTGMKGFEPGLVAQSTLDGRKAWTFDVSNHIDTATAGCSRGLMLPLFTSLGNADGDATNGGTTQRLTVVDGRPKSHLAPSYEGPVLLVEDGWSTPADLSTLDEIMASVDFED